MRVNWGFSGMTIFSFTCLGSAVPGELSSGAC